MSKVPDAYLEARADEIRAAALRVFVRRGLEQATMHEIAVEAGISTGAIYRYYGSKEQLVQSVFSLCGQQNQQLFQDSLAASGSPLAAIIFAGRVVWDRFREPGSLDHFTVNIEAALAGARHAEGVSAEFRKLHDMVLHQIADLVRQAQACGELAADVDPDAVALTLVSALEGLRLLSVQYSGNVDTEGVYGVLTRMLQNLAPARKES